MIQHVQEALGEHGYSLYLDKENENLSDEFEIKKQSANANDDHHVESTFAFNQNDSTYIFIVHEIDERNRLHNDTLDYKKYPVGPVESDLHMRAVKEIDDYYVEVNRKTGVIVAYTHKNLVDKGEQKVTRSAVDEKTTEVTALRASSIPRSLLPFLLSVFHTVQQLYQ